TRARSERLKASPLRSPFPGLHRSSRVLDLRLGRGEPRDRHHVGRAGDVGHPDAVAELHRRGLTAVLAADADLQIGHGVAAPLDADTHQLPPPSLGPPPCSPQMPTFRSATVWRPRSMPIRTSSPTPRWSSTAKGSWGSSFFSR